MRLPYKQEVAGSSPAPPIEKWLHLRGFSRARPVEQPRASAVRSACALDCPGGLDMREENMALLRDPVAAVCLSESAIEALGEFSDSSCDVVADGSHLIAR